MQATSPVKLIHSSVLYVQAGSNVSSTTPNNKVQSSESKVAALGDVRIKIPGHESSVDAANSSSSSSSPSSTTTPANATSRTYVAFTPQQIFESPDGRVTPTTVEHRLQRSASLPGVRRRLSLAPLSVSLSLSLSLSLRLRGSFFGSILPSRPTCPTVYSQDDPEAKNN